MAPSPLEIDSQEPGQSVFLPPAQCDRPYTVSEINDGIAVILESGNTLLWAEGEVSNFKSASSGHCYFTLKDGGSQIPAVMWRSAAIKHDCRFENGMAVVVIASLRVYRKGGYYQLDVHKMQPDGSGAMFARLEKLKEQLAKEGIFDAARKRPIPPEVRRLGLVTSKKGAAFRDIVKVVASRAPQTDIILVDVAVQGNEAAPQIARAVAELNAADAADCMIVGRGGGAAEDLWAFNEEIVARAIFASRILVISAVGHEIDFTIADFVADVRAPTPSAAAEMAVPDTEANSRLFRGVTGRFALDWGAYWAKINQRYQRALRSAAIRQPVRLCVDSRQHCDLLRERHYRALANHLERCVHRFDGAGSRLDALSPLRVLGRGYSVVSLPGGAPVKSARRVRPGDQVNIRFAQGSAGARITHADDPPRSQGEAGASS